MFSFSPQTTVLDCGASRVALGCFATRKSGAVRLEAFAWEPLATGAESGDWLRATGAAFARLSARVPARGPVTLVLPGHLVLTKSVKTPRVEAAKRERIVAFEAEQGIPHALSDVVWGHVVTGESALECDIMLCAAKRDIVEPLCAAAQAAGFVPRLVLPGALALRSAVAACAATEPTVVANLGARSTTFLLLENRRTHARTLPLGGGLAPDTRSPSEQAVAVDAFALRLSQEITRSIVHFKRTVGAAAPTRILLTGGAARLSGLSEALAARTQARVDRFDPLGEIELARSAGDVGALGSHLADLIGAARMRASQTPAINLLPPRWLAEQNARRRQPWFAAAAVLTAASFFPPMHYYREAEAALRHKALAVDAEIAPLRQREARNRANLEKLAKLQQQIAALRGITARRASWPQLFADLQDRFVKVEDVWLERVQFAVDAPSTDAPLRLALSGRMLDRTNPLARVSEDAKRRVVALLTSIAESPYVAVVDSERFDDRQPGILRFDVVLSPAPARPL